MTLFHFLSGLFGKSSTMLLRLCGVLKALTRAIILIQTESAEKLELDEKLVEKVDEYKKEYAKENPVLISTDIVNTAYKLLEYFNKTKLVLAGYEFAVNAPLKESMNEIHLEHKYTGNSGRESKTNLKVIIKRCLLYPGAQFTLKDLLNKFRDVNKTTIRDAFKHLIEQEFGTASIPPRNFGKLTRNGTVAGGEIVIYFNKIPVDKLTDEQLRRIELCGVTMDEYTLAFGNVFHTLYLK